MIMFGLVMSEDICSKQDRRNEILRGLANLPAMMEKVYRDCFEKDNKIVAASERIRKNKSVIILSRGKTSRNKSKSIEDECCGFKMIQRPKNMLVTEFLENVISTLFFRLHARPQCGGCPQNEGAL